MIRRTIKQIESDYKKANAYFNLNSDSLTSLKEIATAVGLSENMLRNSLSKHPRKYNKIRKILAKNKEKLKDASESKTSLRNTPESELEKFSKPIYVIDASITGYEKLFSTLNSAIADGSKIVITSITRKELVSLKKIPDNQGKDATIILSMAVTNPEVFISVHINETIGIPDDCIIAYCEEHKENVILLTSDIEMALKARELSIQTQYLMQQIPEHTKNKKLFVAKIIDNKLVISNFSTKNQSICVVSDGIEYNSGVYELKIGDDVYVATKKSSEYMTFVHFKIVSLSYENNCKTVFHYRITCIQDIEQLPKGGYKSFMREFSRKINFFN